MKQGKVITKVIMLIFLAAVLAYVGYSVFDGIYNPLTTTAAVPCTAGESYSVTLWLVREETPVLSDAYITALSLPDGAKVAAGGEVARGYRSDEAYARQQELNELQARLTQLEYTYAEGEQVRLDAATVAELDQRIDENILSLALSSAAGDLTAAADQAASLRTLVLRRSSSEVDQTLLESNIDTLRAQIDELEQLIAVDSSAVTAGQSGWFAGVCDGFEGILLPELVLQGSVGAFRTVTEQEPIASSRAIGRVVGSATWYAATLVPEEVANRLSRMDTVQLDLHQSLDDLITMDVAFVSAPVDGVSLVTLSCDDHLQDVIHLRQMEAGLVLELYTGIRVPKQAIRVGENGGGGVYVVEGANAVFKSVTMLYDNGNTYVVAEDRSSTNNLWVGDEIIVSARNLYDGKVVK